MSHRLGVWLYTACAVLYLANACFALIEGKGGRAFVWAALAVVWALLTLAKIDEARAGPQETQDLARRVLLGGADMPAGSNLIAKAYKRGWGDCADAIETPWLSDKEAEQAAKDIAKEGA